MTYKRKFLTNDHWHLLLSGQEKLRLYVLRKIGIGCACRDRIFEKAFYLILVYVIVKEVLCFVKKKLPWMYFKYICNLSYWWFHSETLAV